MHLEEAICGSFYEWIGCGAVAGLGRDGGLVEAEGYRSGG